MRQQPFRAARCSRPRVDALVKMPSSRRSTARIPKPQRIGERRKLGYLRPRTGQPREARVERLDRLPTNLAPRIGPDRRKLIAANDVRFQGRRCPRGRDPSYDPSFASWMDIPERMLNELLSRVGDHLPSRRVVQAGVRKTLQSTLDLRVLDAQAICKRTQSPPWALVHECEEHYNVCGLDHASQCTMYRYTIQNASAPFTGAPARQLRLPSPRKRRSRS